MKNSELIESALIEGAEQCEMNLTEYVEYSVENDPTFMRFLFGDHVQDWGIGMTDEDSRELSEYINSIKTQ